MFLAKRVWVLRWLRGVDSGAKERVLIGYLSSAAVR